MARRHRRGSEILPLARLVVERRALRGGLAELGKVQCSRAREGEGRGCEVLLLREEEHQAAGLALVAAGDVKVEDGGDAAGDFAEEGCARGVVGLGLVHGDDEMGELVGAVEVGRAGLWRWWRRRSRRRRRWWASRVTVISFERDLVAIDALSSIQIHIELATLSRLALPKLRLPIERDRAVAANLEPIVWVLALVTLEDMCRCCFIFCQSA